MMATKYWIKLHHEIIDDPKMGKLPDNLFRRFILFCLLAGEEHKDGRLPPVADMAWRLRVEQDVLESELDQLARVGLIEYRADQVFDDYWFVTNFKRRQSAMPKAEYMRRKREEVRKDHYHGVTEPVTNGNAEEEIEEEKEIESDSDTFGGLFDAFIDAAGIPETMLSNSSNVETVNRWVSAGVTAENVRDAVTQLREKGYTIARPASIDNALVVVMQSPKKKSTADMLREALR